MSQDKGHPKGWFEEQDCITCGVRFGLPINMTQNLRNSKKTFYCPNGHTMVYRDDNEADRLRRELDRAKQNNARLVEEANEQARLRADAERRAIRRRKARRPMGEDDYVDGGGGWSATDPGFLDPPKPPESATMTLNLSAREMGVLDELAEAQDMTKTQVMRQALRLYQLIHERLKAGETMSFSGDKERIALFIGPGFGQ